MNNQLNPTLWRTCRTLAGQTRIRLLRQILQHPEQNVSEMAAATGISQSAASQDLRRLQSRGLLRRENQGSSVIYRLVPDPQVPSAAPLVEALKKALSSPDNGEVLGVARAFSHERRIQILQALLNGPQSRTGLQNLTRIRTTPLNHHLRLLMEAGCVQQEGRKFFFTPTKHPLLQALLKLSR